MSQTPCAMGDDNLWPKVRAHRVIGIVEVAHRVIAGLTEHWTGGMDPNEMNEGIRTELNADPVIPRGYHRYQPTFARTTEREAMEFPSDRERTLW